MPDPREVPVKPLQGPRAQLGQLAAPKEQVQTGEIITLMPFL